MDRPKVLWYTSLRLPKESLDDILPSHSQALVLKPAESLGRRSGCLGPAIFRAWSDEVECGQDRLQRGKRKSHAVRRGHRLQQFLRVWHVQGTTSPASAEFSDAALDASY